MNLTKIRILSVVLILSMLVGSVSLVAAQNSMETEPTMAKVQFVHLAPFAEDLEDTSVTLRVDGVDLLTDLKFKEPAPQFPYYDYAGGDHLVEVIPTGTDTPVLSETLTFTIGTYYTVAVIGNGDTQPLEILQLVDDSNPIPTHAKLRITHVAPVASAVEDTMVDICTDDGSIFMGLSGLVYKDNTDPYLLLEEGEYDLMVAEADGTCQNMIYDIPPLWFRINQLADLFIIGDGVNQPVDHYSNTGLLYMKKGNIRFAHYVRFEDDPQDISIDIKIDDEIALTGYDFKDVSAYIDLDPGEHLFEVLEAGTSTVLTSSTVELEAFKFYTSGFIGDDNNQPLELYTLEDDIEAPDTGAKLRIVHAAPVAADIDDTRVDICTHEGEIFEGLSNVPYKAYTDPYLEIPATSYDLYVTAPDGTCENVLFDIPAFELSETGIYDMWIIDHIDIGWPTEPPTSVPVPYINFANVAPFEDNYYETGISIYIDGMLHISDFRFLNFSGYEKFLPGEHEVVIRQTISGDLLAQGTVNLTQSEYYTLHLIGDGGPNQPLEIYTLLDDVVPLPQGAKIRFVHVAPIAANEADTLADVCTYDDLVFDGLTEVPYKAYTDPYRQYDAGYYKLKGTESGTSCQDVIAGLNPFILHDGDVGTIYIFGNHKYPTGMISWPDLSANMLFLDLVGKEFTAK